MFCDIHCHTLQSIGENTLEEMAECAKRLGIGVLGIARYYSDGNLDELPKIDGVDTVSCVIIKADNPSEMSEIATKIRNKTEIVMVHGGDYDINRAACDSSIIDVLCHPELGRKDSGLDHICVKAASENSVAIELNFREILESYKRKRIYILSSIRKNVNLAKKYGARIVTTSGAVNKWGLRSGRDLASFAYLLGLDLGDAIETTSTIPAEMVRINREKLAGKAWEGIRVE
jgi:ribonuclease P/MRP protein subunit RPP1